VDFDPVHARLTCKSDEELEVAARELGISKEVLELFPSEFEESELGMIPKGWEIRNFKDLVEKYIDNRGKTPPIENEGIPLLEVRTLPTTMLVSDYKTDKYVSDETYKTWFRSHLETDDILISTVGTIGLTCIVPDNSKFTIAQNVLGIRSNDKLLFKKYMFYMMKSRYFLDAINARLVTTVQSSIKRKDMETIDIVLAPLVIQNKFIELITPMMSIMQSNEIQTLQKTRDTLLPKLLSGELDVSEIEIDYHKEDCLV
jgi:type I restriction enzyme S subunit